MNVSKWFFLGALTLAVAACGGGGGGGGGGTPTDAGVDPCQQDNPPAECGTSCTSDSSCGIGYYCGSNDVCTADCTPTGGQCGSGRYCDDRGRCQTGDAPVDANLGGGGDAFCPSIEVQTEPVLPVVQLLIDFSGSMNQDFGNDTRVDAVREALLDADDGVVARLEGEVSFGATLYTSFDGDDNPPCPRVATVDPALNNYQNINDQIRDLLDVDELGEDTPTGEAIDAVAAGFPNLGANQKPIIVLATDGDPDTCIEPDPQDINDPTRRAEETAKAQDRSESAAEDAYSQRNIETYVLSVGNDVTEEHLQRLANAGAGKSRDESANPAPVYRANNQSELVDAFDEIVRGARECRFALGGRVTDPEGGTVTLNGDELTYPDDWRVVGDSTLELLGQACQTYLNEDVVEVAAEFTCDSIEDVIIE